MLGRKQSSEENQMAVRRRVLNGCCLMKKTRTIAIDVDNDTREKR
jgi:hypothetical protein